MGYIRYPHQKWRKEGMLELRERGLSLRKIANIYGCSAETVRETINPELKARRNAERAAYNTSPEGKQRQREYRARRAKP